MFRLRVPILMYHDVGNAQLGLSVDADQFGRQMKWLAKAGFQGLALQQLFQPGISRRRRVVITFDDGFAGVYEQAAPILARLGFHATVFAVPDFADSGDTPYGLRPLDWGQLRELPRLGLEIGSHTCSHISLLSLAPEACLDELQRSKQRLENEAHGPVCSFAYPYGHVGGEARQLVRQAGYTAACAVKLGRGLREDRWALQRIQVTCHDDWRSFKVKLSPAYALLMRLRLAGFLSGLRDQVS